MLSMSCVYTALRGKPARARFDGSAISGSACRHPPAFRRSDTCPPGVPRNFTLSDAAGSVRARVYEHLSHVRSVSHELQPAGSWLQLHTFLRTAPANRLMGPLEGHDRSPARGIAHRDIGMPGQSELMAVANDSGNAVTVACQRFDHYHGTYASRRADKSFKRMIQRARHGSPGRWQSDVGAVRTCCSI